MDLSAKASNSGNNYISNCIRTACPWPMRKDLGRPENEASIWSRTRRLGHEYRLSKIMWTLHSASKNWSSNTDKMHNRKHEPKSSQSKFCSNWRLDRKAIMENWDNLCRNKLELFGLGQHTDMSQEPRVEIEMWGLWTEKKNGWREAKNKVDEEWPVDYSQISHPKERQKSLCMPKQQLKSCKVLNVASGPVGKNTEIHDGSQHVLPLMSFALPISVEILK